MSCSNQNADQGVYVAQTKAYLSRLKTYWLIFRHFTTIIAAILSIWEDENDDVARAAKGFFYMSILTDILEALIARCLTFDTARIKDHGCCNGFFGTVGLGIPISIAAGILGGIAYEKVGVFGNHAHVRKVMTTVAPIVSDIGVSNDLAFLTRVNNNDEDTLCFPFCN